MASKIGEGSSVGYSYEDLPNFNDRIPVDATWTHAEDLWLAEHPMKKKVAFAPELIKIREYEVSEETGSKRTTSTKLKGIYENNEQTKEDIGAFFLAASKNQKTESGKILSSFQMEAQQSPKEFFANIFQALASALRDETLISGSFVKRITLWNKIFGDPRSYKPVLEEAAKELQNTVRIEKLYQRAANEIVANLLNKKFPMLTVEQKKQNILKRIAELNQGDHVGSLRRVEYLLEDEAISRTAVERLRNWLPRWFGGKKPELRIKLLAMREQITRKSPL